MGLFSGKADTPGDVSKNYDNGNSRDPYNRDGEHAAHTGGSEHLDAVRLGTTGYEGRHRSS